MVATLLVVGNEFSAPNGPSELGLGSGDSHQVTLTPADWYFLLWMTISLPKGVGLMAKDCSLVCLRANQRRAESHLISIPEQGQGKLYIKEQGNCTS